MSWNVWSRVMSNEMASRRSALVSDVVSMSAPSRYSYLVQRQLMEAISRVLEVKIYIAASIAIPCLSRFIISEGTADTVC